MQMQAPAVVYAEEAFNISCTGNAHEFKHVPSPIITLKIGDACSNHKTYNVKEVQRIFTVTCKTGNHTVRCMTNAKHDPEPIELHGEMNVHNVIYCCMYHYAIGYILCLYHSDRKATKNNQPTT